MKAQLEVKWLLFVLLTQVGVSESLPDAGVTELELPGRLQHLISHYAKNPDGVNVDGLYGLRIAQGALAAAVKRLSSTAKPDVHLVSVLTNITKILDKVCRESQAKIKVSEASYYESFKPVLDTPYPVTGQVKDLSKHTDSQTQSKQPVHRYDEHHGDICYTKLLGTYHNTDTDTVYHKCYIDDDCLNLMMEGGQRRYVLTHQLLYFMLAQKVGCTDKINSAIKPLSLNHLEQRFCEKIWTENEQLYTNTSPHIRFFDLDLFIEQGVLCAMQGYGEIITLSKLRAVLSYQDRATGCYGPAFRHLGGKRWNITKRKEKADVDRCLAHTTGLAAAYLALSINKYYT